MLRKVSQTFNVTTSRFPYERKEMNQTYES